MTLSKFSSLTCLSFFKKARFWLAGPVALFLAIFFMASMSLWLPAGAAKINNLIIPIILFPLIWAVCFFYPLLDTNIRRASIITLTLLFVVGGLVMASVMGVLL